MTSRQPSAIASAEARDLWDLYGLSGPEELVLEDLALAMGVMVVEGGLHGAEARLVRKGERGVVRVQQGLRPLGRRRFAIAHELGHWRLHREKSQLFVCTSEDMIARYRSSPIEAEANFFAAALLMPEHLFIPMRGDERPSFDQLETMAEFFGASLTATAMRWMELAHDYCALVVCEGDKVKWWRGSDRFEESVWISPGQRISRYSAAASLADGCEMIGPETVGLDAWAERNDLDVEDVIEESRLLSRYNQRMTLLWIP